MWNVLWEWVFPDHGKTNDDTWIEHVILAIDEGQFWKWVTLLPLETKEADIVIMQNDVFQQKVHQIVENILHDAIQTYLSHKAETAQNVKDCVSSVRNLVQETLGVQRDMMLKADAIEDTFLYMGDTVDVDDFDLDEAYKLEMIETLLSPYREYIISLLMMNEDKMRQREQAPKRFRRRQNAKKRNKK